MSSEQENTEPAQNLHLLQTPLRQVELEPPSRQQLQNFRTPFRSIQPFCIPTPPPLHISDLNNNQCNSASTSASNPSPSAIFAFTDHPEIVSAPKRSFNFRAEEVLTAPPLPISASSPIGEMLLPSPSPTLAFTDHPEVSSAPKRSLNFRGEEGPRADEGPRAKQARSALEVTDYPVPDCWTVEDRIGAELDMLLHQYDLENTLTLTERTRLHRFLVTYLIKVQNPPCTDYEVNNMTVYVAIQVIHRATYKKSELLTLCLERYDGDLEKSAHIIDARVIRSLQAYWFEVRPNFLPKEGLSKKKVSFISPNGSVCYLYSRFFFVNNLGNDLFRVRQVPFAVKNEMKKLVSDNDRRNLDKLKRKIQLAFPARHDPRYEVPSASEMLKAVTQVIIK